MFKCVAGLDVHQKNVVCTIIKEENGEFNSTIKEFKTFRKDLKNLARWLITSEVEFAVMESTGIFWKSVYDVLEDFGIIACVVNARHVKNVPGRKTDVADSKWLAELAQYGLLNASFIPPKDIRQLRMLTRYRRKLTQMRGAEKNRLHKTLDDAGIRLGSVVTDIDGVSARNMIDALIEQKIAPQTIVDLARGKLQKKKEELALSLDGELSDRHRFLLRQIHNHIKNLDLQITQIDEQVVEGMNPYKKELGLLQTVPGINLIGAAMLIAEVGTDMKSFKNKDHLSSWAGICPGNNESGGKKKVVKQGRVTSI